MTKFGTRLRGYFGVVGTRWVVEVPKSSWRQGKAEKMVQLFKSLYTTLLVNEKILSDSQLRLLFSRIQVILNTRPLGSCRMYEDGEARLIRPIDLISGTGRGPPLLEEPTARRRLAFVEEQEREFWSKWRRLVIPDRVKTRALRQDQNIKVGDLVLLLDEDLGGTREYPVALVTNVRLSDDGRVRSVAVRVHLGDLQYRVLARPVQQVALLEDISERTIWGEEPHQPDAAAPAEDPPAPLRQRVVQ